MTFLYHFIVVILAHNGAIVKARYNIYIYIYAYIQKQGDWYVNRQT